MSAAAAMAALSGALGLAAAWEVIGALDERVVRRTARRWAALVRGRDDRAAERRRVAAVGAAAALAAGWLLGGPVAGAALATAGPLGAGRLVALRDGRRRQAMAAAVPALARAIADALGAGHSIRGAVTAAARDGGVPGPLGGEAARLADRLALGEPTEAALAALRAGVRVPALDTAVAAILLQREAGGDLAGLLRTLAAQGEQAARVEADAHAATAQARFTALLVAALPVAGAGLAELAQPGFLLALLDDPLGVALVGAAVVLQAAALVAVRRIARLEAP